MINTDTASLQENAKEASRIAGTLEDFIAPLAEFHTERNMGELTVMFNGVNVLAERSDAAASLIVAVSMLRTQLVNLELAAHTVIEANQAHQYENEESFFNGYGESE